METPMTPSDDVVPLQMARTFLAERLAGFMTSHPVSISAKGEIVRGGAASMGIGGSDGAVLDVVKVKRSTRSTLRSANQQSSYAR
jgi:hypothetical protein